MGVKATQSTLRLGIAVPLPWLAAVEFEKWIRFGRQTSDRSKRTWAKHHVSTWQETRNHSQLLLSVMS